ncbi:MAG: Flp pilus assembly complex ATPase component TadA [Bacilli bacterium]|nr:Flp pilus assembly complex ATPase component TadA [Bacilli bacterium]
MSESMNFGNIGFGSVSSGDNSNQQPSSAPVQETAPAQEKKDEMPNLLAGVKEAQAKMEEERKKREEEEQAFKDFQEATAKKSNYEKDADNFSQIDFGPLKKYLDDDDITDISYSNGGQLWLKSLSQGVYRAEQQEVDNALIEKIAFQCSNVMGKTFNMAHPFLDSESAELRMNFVHESIARNGIAVVFRKTPAKIRLEKQKLLNEKYIRLSIHDFLINCVKGHCNIIVCGETGSGKTELVKYLASHTRENEKLITIEDTLELHLDRIFPHRDIVAMKTNNIASYSDVLVTCMRQNPIWILLSEVRSAEAVTAVRNSISSGHYILSTIHADKAESIPHRMYSLLESNIDVEQFLKTIYRYVQIGVFVRGRYKPEEKRFVREIAGVCEFFVDEVTNKPEFNNIYLKTVGGEETYNEPTKHIKGYLEGQGVDITNLFGENHSSLKEANDANGDHMDTPEEAARKLDLEMDKKTNSKETVVNTEPVTTPVEVATEAPVKVEVNTEPKVQEVKTTEPLQQVSVPQKQIEVATQPQVAIEPQVQTVQNVQPEPVATVSTAPTATTQMAPQVQPVQQVQPMPQVQPVQQVPQVQQPVAQPQTAVQPVLPQPTQQVQPVQAVPVIPAADGTQSKFFSGPVDFS